MVDKSKIYQIAFEINEIARVNKIIVWFDHGTLLGLVRDGDILPWDNDIDISLFGKDFDTLKMHIIREMQLKSDVIVKASPRNIKIRVKDCPLVIDLSKYNNIDGCYTKEIVLNRKFKKVAVLLSGLATLALLIRPKLKIFNLISFLFMKIVDSEYLCVKIKSRVPVKYFEKFSKIVFKGHLFNIPKNPCEYLSFRYGAEWETQNKNWRLKDDKTVLM